MFFYCLIFFVFYHDYIVIYDFVIESILRIAIELFRKKFAKPRTVDYMKKILISYSFESLGGSLNRLTHLIIMILLSALLLVFGTAGYMLIEGWSLIDALYMSVITLATVGFGEVHPTSDAGQIFTIVLIILGVGFCLYAVGNILQFLVEGRIRIILGRRKLDKQINQLKNHFIVCGYGRMARDLC